ncbi:hypothetical protein QJS10_CPB12g00230 [Acorus calamus]|uniref:Uncharacterized protein n=1 Tax=Acorus calamus TaxID=4465 RepID=A0AAV9DP48_ACOCL|nr:hypothetical protein QJS10_CPB12g00230 [Acorus calamus]
MAMYIREGMRKFVIPAEYRSAPDFWVLMEVVREKFKFLLISSHIFIDSLHSSNGSIVLYILTSCKDNGNRSALINIKKGNTKIIKIQESTSLENMAYSTLA